MNTHMMIRFALPLALLAGCGVDPRTDDRLVDEQRALASDFTWDATALTAIPDGGIAPARLPLAAFGEAAIRQRLLQSTEAFQTTASTGARSELESASYRFSTDASRGLMLVVSKMVPGPQSDQNEGALQLRAIDRLKAWGIGAGEIGPIWQRRMLATAEDNGVVGAPTRLAYKTFVLRAVLGVRVDGHRAVVTHGLDGSFRRAIAVWPALAASGHLLHTQQTIPQIKARAAAALAAQGFTDGKITLRWKYVATPAQNGEVTLKLMAGARTAGVASNDLGEEPYEVNVDVAAVR